MFPKKYLAGKKNEFQENSIRCENTNAIFVASIGPNCNL